jgi:DNA-binding protein HU-beta
MRLRPFRRRDARRHDAARQFCGTFFLTAVNPNAYRSAKFTSIDRRKGGSPLNKGDLVGKIAKEVAITKRQAEEAFNSIFGAIEASLKKGQKVTIVGFGTFAVSKRKARTGRNPQTGAAIKIAARKVPKFSPGKDLKLAVAGK